MRTWATAGLSIAAALCAAFGRDDSLMGRGSLAKFDQGGALAALVEGWLGDGGDVGVALEVFAEGAAENAHAGAVDDADAGEAGEEGLVDVALDLGFGLVGGAADDVELHGHVVGGV